MAEDSGISWTDNTFNPWIGCTKVSPACANCYAEREQDNRHKRVKWGPSGTRSVTSLDNWKKPLKWDREAAASGKRLRVFCASLADVFENWQGPIHAGSLGEVLTKPYLDSESQPENWQLAWPEHMESDPQGWRYVTMDDVRNRLFALIDATPNLDWLLLTKRPENILKMWPERYTEVVHGKKKQTMGLDHSHPNPSRHVTSITEHTPLRHNVWLGCSVENQEYADKRIPELLTCRDLSPVLFLSCEPLLGSVDLTRVKVPEAKDLLRRAWDTEGSKFNALQDDEDNFHQGPATIDWVIAGGESGPKARPSDDSWFRSLRSQCDNAGVAFHFKQFSQHDYGKSFNVYDSFPEDLRAREFPR